MFGQDHNMLAAEIVLKSPVVVVGMGEDDVLSAELIAVYGNIYTVEITGSSRTQTEVIVDIERKSIMDILVGTPQNFENEEIERVIGILQTESIARALLAQGDIIGCLANYSIGMGVSKIGETNNIVEKRLM